MNLNSTTYTPPKINMETENSPFEKEDHLPSLHVVGSMLTFQGVDGLSLFPKVVTAKPGLFRVYRGLYYQIM